MINPKAIEAMQRHLNEALNGCQIESGWPLYQSYRSTFLRFSKEALKIKGKWLRFTTLFDIFIEELRTVMKEYFPKRDEISGPLTNLLRPETIDQIVKKILGTVESIPRSYHIYIPLPAATLGVEEVAFTSDIALIEIHDKEKVPGGYRQRTAIPFSLDSISLEMDKPYLRFASTGYAGTSIDDSAYESALSKFKQFVYLGIMFKFLEKHEVLTSLFFGSPHHEAIPLDLEDPEHLKAHAQLPNNIADLIDRISIVHDFDVMKEVKESGKVGIEKLLHNQLRDPINLLTRKNTDILSAPIRSAVEWAFDANNTENPTVSFIQTCIGLEAILGEDIDQEAPLTATLADRCAYLFGSDSAKRKIIRTNFRKLYSIRSKLVHGRVITLSEEETNFISWGNKVLDGLIRKELASIRE